MEGTMNILRNNKNTQHKKTKFKKKKKKKKAPKASCGSPPSKIEKLKLGIVVFCIFYGGWENQTLSDLS